MKIQREDILVPMNLLDIALEVLDYENDRGFNCFQSINRIIAEVKGTIEKSNARKPNILLFSNKELDNSSYVLINSGLLKRLVEILRNRQQEYVELIEISSGFLSVNNRLLVDLKNKRDSFTKTSQLWDFLNKHEEKYVNYETLIKKISDCKYLYVEIRDIIPNFFVNSKIIVKVDRELIQFDEETLTIGNPIDTIFNLKEGIYLEVNINDLLTIQEDCLISGYNLIAHNGKLINIIFK